MSIIMAGPAGSSELVYGIASQVIWNLTPCPLKQLGMLKRKPHTRGTYQAGSDANVTASITLAVDRAPELHVSNYTSQGHDLIAEYAILLGSSSPPEVRMYPTNLQTANATSQQVAWRAVYNTISDCIDADKQLFFLQDSCETWSYLNLLRYGLAALDDFVFTLGKGGKMAESVDARALRMTMVKVH
jgi:hypothetical protein